MRSSGKRQIVGRYRNTGLLLASLSPRLSAYWAQRRRTLLGIALVVVGLALCFVKRPAALPPASPGIVAPNPDALLFSAIRRKDADQVRAALHQCANPNAVSAGRTALSFAVESRDYAIVQALLERGADPNAGAGAPKGLPLTIAAGCGDETLVQMLLGRGANPNRQASDSDLSACAVAEKNWQASGKRDTRFANIMAMLQRAAASKK